MPAAASMVCGTCANGTPAPYGMVRCELGWEAHDAVGKSYNPKTKKTVPCVMGHGELEEPEATPDCRCGCQPPRWKRQPGDRR